MIEFFNLGERDIHLRAARGFTCGNQLRQPVQGLRTKYQIDIWRTLHYFCAFLAGDATPYAYEKIRVGRFKMPDASQIMKYLFLGFLPHRAGVEQDHIGLGGIICFFHALRVMQHVRHLVRVVLVHLAAKRFNIKFFSHTYLQPYRNIVRTTQYCDRSEVATNARVSAHKAVGAFITAATIVQT